MKIKNSNILTLIICILIPLAIGGLSYLATGNAMQVYNMMNKPALSPPPIVFPIVWNILYTLMGISSYKIYISDNENKGNALFIYGIQLFFNFMWSVFFFRLLWFLFAFIWLLIMIILIAIMIYKFYKINKLAGILQIPYILWCIFAAYLNFSVYLLNM